MSALRRVHTCVVLVGAGCIATACDQLPGKPAPRLEAPALDTAAGFASFYGDRCAGCHGIDGTHGPARPLRDSVYLASVPDASLLSIVRDGIHGTRMPGTGGASITGVSDAQIQKFLTGMKRAWMSADAIPSAIAWQANAAVADLATGHAVFDARCGHCHPRARNAAGSSASTAGGDVMDPFYVRLVSDQHLRTSIVFGRSDLGMPGAAGPFVDASGARVETALTASEVDALVAYIASQRTASTLTTVSKGDAR